MRTFTLTGITSGISILKAAFIISSHCLTHPTKIQFNVEAAKVVANKLKEGQSITVYVKDNPIAEDTVANNFSFSESEYEPAEVKMEIKTPPSIEMKITSPKIKGPEMPTDVTLADNILQRAMAAAMTAEVNNVLQNLMPEIRKIINHEITNNFVKRVEVKVNDSEWKDAGHQHKSFPDLLRVCMTRLPNGERLNTWLVGSAGTGKTTACYNVAKALDARTFGAIGTSDNKYELSGFTDAHGKVVNTVFRDIFVNGGVMLLDEIDSWYPNALLALQAALSNGFCAFPDGVFERHEDCIVICAANTYGQGEVTEYVGRMKQDAAFLDRFVFFKWDIDEQLERHISGNVEWVTRVQSVRKRAAERGVKVLITPRASIYGSALLAAGFPWKDVETMILRKSMTAEQWKSVQ